MLSLGPPDPTELQAGSGREAGRHGTLLPLRLVGTRSGGVAESPGTASSSSELEGGYVTVWLTELPELTGWHPGVTTEVAHHWVPFVLERPSLAFPRLLKQWKHPSSEDQTTLDLEEESDA